MLQCAANEDIPADIPWNELTEDARNIIMNGHGEIPRHHGLFEYLEHKKYKMHVRIFLSRYRGLCQMFRLPWDRLRQEARDVRIGGKSITT